MSPIRENSNDATSADELGSNPPVAEVTTQTLTQDSVLTDEVTQVTMDGNEGGDSAKNPPHTPNDLTKSRSSESSITEDSSVKKVKPSPFAKRKSSTPGSAVASSAKKPRGNLGMTLYHIKPTFLNGEPCDATVGTIPDGATIHNEGFAIIVDGFGAKVATDPLYSRKEPVNIKYIEDIDCVKHVFEYVLHGVQQINQGGYPVKFLVWCTPAEMSPVDDEQIKQFATDTFVPSLMNLGKLFSSAEPIIDGPIITVNNWSALMSNADLEKFVVKTYAASNKARNLKTYYHDSKLNVYSLHNRGEVPEALIKRLKLQKNHLLPEDHEKVVLDVASV